MKPSNSEPMINFRKNLAKWSVLVSLNSIPSFSIAVMDSYQSGEAILAMVLGILILILSYTFLSSSSFYNRWQSGLFGKAINVAVRLRCLYLVLLLVGCAFILLKIDSGVFSVLIFPEGFTGWFSISAIEFIGGDHSFVSTLMIVLLQGAMQSVLLAILACLIYAVLRLQLRYRRVADLSEFQR